MSSASAPFNQPSRLNSEARSALEASLTSVGTSLSQDLHARATNLHTNASHLSKQEADVSRETGSLQKQNDQLQKMADNSRDKIKEVGDVQNWAEMLERDLLVLEETLRMVDGEELGFANGVGDGTK